MSWGNEFHRVGALKAKAERPVLFRGPFGRAKRSWLEDLKQRVGL